MPKPTESTLKHDKHNSTTDQKKSESTYKTKQVIFFPSEYFPEYLPYFIIKTRKFWIPISYAHLKRTAKAFKYNISILQSYLHLFMTKMLKKIPQVDYSLWFQELAFFQFTTWFELISHSDVLLLPALITTDFDLGSSELYKNMVLLRDH